MHGVLEALRSRDDVTEGMRAFELFCTPSLSNLRADNHEELVERARNHLKRAETRRVSTSICDVQTYIINPEGPPIANVLVVHGWTGEASFMGAIGEFLRRRGFRVILMDMPAHGKSDGHVMSLFDCAAAILEVAEKLGPIQFAVGHSIGAMAVLTVGEGHFPLPRKYPFEAYVLVAMPDKFVDVTGQFSSEQGLSSKAQRIFEGKLERLCGRPLEDFSGVTLLSNTDRPTLLVHCKDDSEVSFCSAENMAAEVEKVELMSVDHLGHRTILYAPPVVRATSNFFKAYLAGE